MALGLHPGIIFGVAIALFIIFHIALKWTLPAAFVLLAVIVAFIGDFGFPYRHLVEGGFGFINLVLALFAGTFFGHMMRESGAANAAADGIINAVGGRVLVVLTLVALPIFVVGMFVGLSGVAVLSAGVFAVPALKRIGFDDAGTAAFIAVVATAGMIAPPVNVPAMLLADGVNMPWTGVTKALLFLSVPVLIAAIVWFSYGGGPKAVRKDVENPNAGFGDTIAGLAPFLLMVAIWLAVRIFPDTLPDPASPLILVIGGLAVMHKVRRPELRNVVYSTFTGTPLLLGAVLVTVGIVVQVMTLTGVRGWLVVSTMGLGTPWIYPGLLFGMPLLGGALTSMVVADVMGVPAAFWLIKQDMIINVSALSGLAALAEFVPPTSIAAALSCYVVGGGTVGQVFRRSWPPLLVLVLMAVIMIMFAPQLAGIIT